MLTQKCKGPCPNGLDFYPLQDYVLNCSCRKSLAVFLSHHRNVASQMADVSTDQDAPALDLMTALDLDDGRVPVPGAR